MRIRVLLAGALLLAACGPPPPPRNPRADLADAPRPTADHVRRIAEQFDALETAFLDWYYEAYPVDASRLGIHDHDDRLPPHDRASIQRRTDDLLDWLAELDRVPLMLLDDPDRYDHALLDFAVRAALLDLEEVRPWAHDPRHYTTLITDGITAVAERGYAPVSERSAALTARMREATGLLEAARANMRRPPRVWTEMAIADTRGLIEYLEDGLPAALASQGAGAAVRGTVATAAAALVDALQEHAGWLEAELLPRSTGEFALGPYLLQRKLFYEEHVNLTVAELQRLNEGKIAEYRAEVERLATEIDPDRTPRQVMDSISSLHPDPSELIPMARAMVLEARDWVREAGLVTLPSEELPEVVEMPPHGRGGFASLDAPGPFATTGLESWLRLTNVEASWTEEQKEQHLSYFSRADLVGITVHNTFPGHLVRLAQARELDSATRKTFQPRTLTEGWAHYAEQLVLDEGFREEDPAVRLAMLRRALQSHARWYAGLHLHAFGTSIDDVVRRFMEIAYVDEFPARREVLRVTHDPTALHEALGRMQILELRDDYREHMEEQREEYSLQEFHDGLLGLGLPLTLARQAMLNPPIGPRLEPYSPRRRP